MSNIIRPALIKDVNRLYEICCAVQLRPQPKDNDSGFLMSDYMADPEGMKEYICECVTKEGLTALVSERDRKIDGWLLGYSKQAWLEEGWSSNIRWLEQGVENALENDFVLLEKIAVHPSYRRRKVGEDLYKYFAKESTAQHINFLFAEIIEHILEKTGGGLHSLGIRNNTSINFFRAMGAKRVGESEKAYNYDGSFLGDKGCFKDGIYLAAIGR